MRQALIALAAVLLSSQLQAATVFKCVDAAGKVTFTQNQNCPRSSDLDDVISAHNAAPSGSSAPVQMAQPRGRSITAQAKEPSRGGGVTVVGEKPKCARGGNEQDHRKAVVSGRAAQGMTRVEIESMYGKPDNVTVANGRENYRYYNAQKKQYVSVGFDQGGCANWVYESKDR